MLTGDGSSWADLQLLPALYAVPGPSSVPSMASCLPLHQRLHHWNCVESAGERVGKATCLIAHLQCPHTATGFPEPVATRVRPGHERDHDYLSSIRSLILPFKLISNFLSHYFLLTKSFLSFLFIFNIK